MAIVEDKSGVNPIAEDYSGYRKRSYIQPVPLVVTGLANDQGAVQAVVDGAATVGNSASAAVISRNAPATTAIQLPSIRNRTNRAPLSIVDFSTNVTDHIITLTPYGTEKVMQQATWPMYSTAASLASLRLYPSIELNQWIIAP